MSATAVQQRPAGHIGQNGGDDDIVSSAATTTATGARAGETQFVVQEVTGEGQETATNGAVEAHEEMGSEGSENAEEFAEATPAQLAQAVGESAASDLEAVEEYTGESAAEAGGVTAEFLPEAGEANGEASEEFLPILASIASTVVPMLASKAGPALAKGVIRTIKPAALQLLRRRARGGGVLGVIGKLLEVAEQPGATAGESSMETVSEAMVLEATQLLEAIVDIDDRKRITPTTREPWKRICALRITMPSGAVYRGSGFLIGPRTVATAGHCVYLHNQGGWARRIEVIPGADGTKRPYGAVTSTTFRSVRGWVRDKKPESDYGCIILPPNAFAGKGLGSWGFAAFPTSVLLAQPAVVAGYPGDKPFAELWGASRKIKTVTAKQLIYNIATMGGQSGCPVYIKRNGSRFVVGIHNYGSSTGNSATRITEAVFKNLQTWSKLGS